MRDACIRAVTNALGRDPTQAEVRNIETRIQSAMLRGARENPAAWRALSPEERMIDAGRRAAQEIVAEGAKTLQRAELAIVAQDRLNNYRASQVAEGNDANGVDALERVLVHKYDERNGGMRPVESQANATFDFAMSQIADIFETVNPGLWQRMQRDIRSMAPLRKAFVDALHGVREGIPPEIVQAAERYHEIASALREQFNAAGGVIGKLEDWGAPHTWSARLAERGYEGFEADARARALLVSTRQFKKAEVMRRQMLDRAREQFVTDMMGSANRRRYVHEDGSYYNDAEMREFFGEAWSTIVSDGMTKESAPGFPGGAVKANRGSQHRVIHLMPDRAYDMLSKYSEQNVLEAMVSGLRRMSRDVALVETLGPNADARFQEQLSASLREAAQIDPSGSRRLQGRARYLQNLYDTIAGNNPPPVRGAWETTMRTLRSIQVASKLGSAVITSISDFATLYQTAILNRLNPMQVALNSSLAWAPKSRRFARRMGLVMDTVLADMERFSGEALTAHDLSSKVASAVMRISGLSFVTDARRLGFSMTMMDSIGHLTRQRQYADVTKLAEGDQRILAAKGISQATWDIWRAANIDSWGANHTLLTPDNIMAVEGAPLEARRQAVIDLLSIVREEQDLAVVTPGARERAAMLFGTQGGTFTGEIVRSVMLFKSFPWTFMTRHGERLGINGAIDKSLRGDHSGWRDTRFDHFASLFIFMTAGGVVAQWINDILSGKDPRTMNVMSSDPDQRSVAVRNWMQASLKGGALGIYGDFLFSQTNPYSGNSLQETIMGPTFGTASEAIRLTAGNGLEALQGEDTHIGSEAVRFARGHTPGANLWFLKGLGDRYIWNQLQDMTDPGAVDRMVDRQQSMQQTNYWWSPSADVWAGEGPDRAPDLEAGVRAN